MNILSSDDGLGMAEKPHGISVNIFWINRTVLFLIYFLFDFLKIVSLSPAEELVAHLHRITIGEFTLRNTQVKALHFRYPPVGF